MFDHLEDLLEEDQVRQIANVFKELALKGVEVFKEQTGGDEKGKANLL